MRRTTLPRALTRWAAPHRTTSIAGAISVRRMASASLANVLFLALHAVLFVALTPWALRALGDDKYGLWTLMLAIMGFASLANFGTTSAAVKYVSQFRASADSQGSLAAVVTFCYAFMLVAGAAACLLVWALRQTIASRVAHQSGSAVMLGDALGLMAVGILPNFLGQTSKGVLLGLVRNELAGALDLGHDTLLWVGALVIGVRNGTAIHLALWLVAVNLLWFVPATYVVSRNIPRAPLRLRQNAGLAREMLRYSLLTWAASLGITLFQTADRVFVGMLAGSAAVGVYAIGTSLALRLSMLAGQITQVLVPFVSERQARGLGEELRTVFRTSSRLLACLLVQISGVLVLCIDPILRVWISSAFSDAYSSPFRALIACYAVYCMVRPAHQFAQGLGWLGVPTLAFVGSGVGVLALLSVLSPLHGLSGAVAAKFASVTVLCVNLHVAKRLGLRMVSTVVRDLGPALVLMLATVSVASYGPSTPVRLLSTAALAALSFWLALRGQDTPTLLRSMLSPKHSIIWSRASEEGKAKSSAD